MGQLFLDVLGKRGMLTIWSFIIVVQVSIIACTCFLLMFIAMLLVCDRRSSRRGRLPRDLRFRTRSRASWIPFLASNELAHSDTCQRCVVCDGMGHNEIC